MEERADVREVTFQAWKLAISSLAALNLLDVVPPNLLSWFSILMSPVGTPLDPSMFYQPLQSRTGTNAIHVHNVDKPMMVQDLSLVTEESILRGRVLGAKALAFLLSVWPVAVSTTIRLQHWLLMDIF